MRGAGAHYYVSYFRVYSEAPLYLNSLNCMDTAVLCIPLVHQFKTQIRLDELGQRKDGSSDNFSVLMFKTLVLKTIILMV